MTPKVTVIVPVYNVEQYLPQCLESLINQTFKDIEIICFNDASPDGSLQILKEYQKKDQRIQIIDSQINIKQGGGRNAGIRASSAPYVMFVDSDDWIAPEFVENLYSIISEKNADIATCDYYQHTQTNGRKQLFISLGIKTSEDTEFLKHKLAENGAPIWAAIYRKELFTDNDLWFPENLFYEDNAICAALYCSANKIVKIDKPLYYYRIRPQSTTFLKNDPRFFDRLKAAEILINHFKRLGLYDNYSDDVMDIFLKQYYRNSIFGCFEHFKPVPYARIEQINKTIKQEIPKEKLLKFINSQSTFTKLILVTARISPRIAYHLLKIRQQTSKLIHN